MPALVIRDYEPADHEMPVELDRYGLAAAGIPEDVDINSGDLDDIAGMYVNQRGFVLVGEVEGAVVTMGGLRQIDAVSCELRDPADAGSDALAAYCDQVHVPDLSAICEPKQTKTHARWNSRKEKDSEAKLCFTKRRGLVCSESGTASWSLASA